MLIGTAPNECSLTWYTVMFTAYAGSILGAAAAVAAANARASIMKTMMPETSHSAFESDKSQSIREIMQDEFEGRGQEGNALLGQSD
jgi:hypothetical protein